MAKAKAEKKLAAEAALLRQIESLRQMKSTPLNIVDTAAKKAAETEQKTIVKLASLRRGCSRLKHPSPLKIAHINMLDAILRKADNNEIAHFAQLWQEEKMAAKAAEEAYRANVHAAIQRNC